MFSQARIASILVLVIIVVFIGISTVLWYHWKRYGIHKNTVRMITTTYFIVSLILLCTLVAIALPMITS